MIVKLKPNELRKNNQLAFNVTSGELARLQILANASSLSLSSYIRCIVARASEPIK